MVSSGWVSSRVLYSVPRSSLYNLGGLIIIRLCVKHKLYNLSSMLSSYRIHRTVKGILTKNIINFSQNVVQVLA